MTKPTENRIDGRPTGFVFVTCLLLGATVHAQTDGKDRPHPSDAATLGDSADTEATETLRPAAEQGDANAQFALGLTYYVGVGVEHDKTEAARWYRLAAEQGYAMAQHNLGLMYARGEGVEQDHTEAARWYRLAAEQGDANAQFLLGMMYYQGEGVGQDHTEAARWYRLAAEQGDAAAQFLLGVMYYQGEGVGQDHTEAARWYRLAAEQGQAMAQFILGTMYARGEGVEHDLGEALSRIRLAAESGNDGAAEALESRETWRCFGESDAGQTNVLLTLNRLGSGGEVSVAGVKHTAAFFVDGLDRQWAFTFAYDDDDGRPTADYTFVIEPDGTGLYYSSFPLRGQPSQTFVCKRSP